MLVLGKHNPAAGGALVIALSCSALAVGSGNAQTTAPASAQVTVGDSSAKPEMVNPPLAVQSNEGFWGHLNPFARKKWVKRQLAPVEDRLNELDELSSSNARAIKDVDARAQAGIQHAQSTADAASQQAAAASGVAQEAQLASQQSAARTKQIGVTVANLDDYQAVSETEIRFRPGQTALNAKAKEALDGIAASLQGSKGYLIEVKGFSSTRGQAGIETSQHLANSVVRYLVEQHDVPVYRIHLAGLGNATHADTNGLIEGGNSVYVTLVHNSLAALNSSAHSDGSPIGNTQQLHGGYSSASAAPQPSAQQ